MKPIRLEMSAFGPYAGVQVVDFRNLGDRTFFLIHGPTGSGKTSILDAICYALYGDTSGAERSGRQMRSQQADPSEQTFVNFDFMLGQKSYRIFRSPEQDRPKKRGEGFTRINPEATLWDRTDEPGDAEGRVIESKPTMVTEAVEGLLRFNSGQFRQVIMLPQGRFRQLLLADSRERQTILETLFDAERFRKLQDKLKRKMLDLQADLGELVKDKARILKDAGVENEAGLAARTEQVQTAVKELELRKAELEKAETTAAAKLEKARDDDRKIREKEAAAGVLSKLSEKKKEFESHKSALSSAQKALGVVSVEEYLAGRKKELANAEKALEQAASDRDRAEKELAEAESKMNLEEKRGQERDEVARRVIFLENLAKKVETLDVHRRKTKEIDQNVRNLARNASDAEYLVTEASKNLEVTEKSAEATQREAARTDALRLECEKLSSNLDGRIRLDDLRERRGTLEKELAAAIDAAIKAAEKRDAAKKILAEVDAEWRNGQAAVLANLLKDGAPCPVCGSLDHPHPASQTLLIPSNDELKERQAELESMEEALIGAKKSETDLATRQRVLLSEMETARTALGQAAEADATELKSALKTKMDELKKAETAAKKLANLEKELTRMKTAKSSSEKEADEARKALEDAKRQLAVAESAVKNAEEEIPADLQSPQALKKAKNEADTLAKKLNDQLENARKRRQKAETSLSAAQSAQKAGERAVNESRARLAEQQTAFEKAVRDAGFSSEDQYRAARMFPNDMENLDSRIRRFENDLASAESQAKKTADAAAGLTGPDLSAFEKTAADAKKALLESVNELATMGERRKRLQKLGAELRKTGEKFGQLEKEFGIIGRLANAADGKNKHNIDFQRFVLGALLDDVLTAATNRLKVMTSGRYHLQRALGVGDKRKAWGLDLEVHDAYTGRSRPVATLSGGESFLASLSLALGLAEVVQSYSGGIRLDTIFVDEGFGSLDSEALDLALNALTSLRQGGRMVGLISHVPEMRERIDARLEITASRTGSSAQFCL